MMQAIQAQQAPEAASDLVAAVVAEIVAMASRKEKIEPPQMEKGEDVGPRSANLQQDLAGLDAKASPEEKAGFCTWLVTVASATAEAGCEGGFLGIGAVRVSEQEKAALEVLKQALGLA